MHDSKTIVTGAIAGLPALGLTVSSGSALAAKEGFEKCVGVVKAGKNDCGTSQHGCAGQAKKDGDKEEWVVCSERHLREDRRRHVVQAQEVIATPQQAGVPGPAFFVTGTPAAAARGCAGGRAPAAARRRRR